MYIDLVSIIAIIGLVLTLLRRDRLGPRVTAFMLGGCGALLFSHLTAAMAASLRWRGWTEPLTRYFDSLSGLLDAAGVALIIAAVFVGRLGSKSSDGAGVGSSTGRR
jgi:hypothetical protein